MGSARSVQELKAVLSAFGVDSSECCEKSDLQRLVSQTMEGEFGEPGAEPPPQFETKSVKELKAALELRGVNFDHCREKCELVQLLNETQDQYREQQCRQKRAKALATLGFAVHDATGRQCWIEFTTDTGDCHCYWDDGSSNFLAPVALSPLTAQLPQPRAFDGSFEAARAEAFHAGKILVVAVERDADVKASFIQELVLASEDIVPLFDENAVFWSGPLKELRAVHGQQLAPCGAPSLAMVLPLAVDAMRVLSVIAVTDKTVVVEALVDALESLDAHRQAAEARLVSEGVLLRQQQDDEFVASLAADQEAEHLRRRAEEADAEPRGEAAPEPIAVAHDGADASGAGRNQEALAERRQRLAQEFQQEIPASPPDPAVPAARILLRLPAGSRVERTFSADTPLACVYQWAECCAYLPEGRGRELAVPEEFELATSFPPRRLGQDVASSTLADLGLAPSAVLLTVETSAVRPDAPP